MSQCDTKTGCCETSSQAPQGHHGSKGDCCPVEKSLQNCGCPVERATELWQKGFFCAIKEVQKDILKEKIRKAWGAKFEKEADAVVEAMGAHWQAIQAQAMAQKSLKENLGKIYQQSNQK